MELIERDPHLGRLEAAVAAASNGSGGVVLVGGEAGIGKTSLLKAFVARYAELPLWWGGCDALETPAPLAPLYDIARSARTAFASTLQRDVGVGAVFAEVLRELESLGPALVVIEDAHWADDSTL